MRRVLDISTAKVAVELTSRCNLRCAMCPMSNLNRAFMDMRWPLVEKIAADFASNGIRVQWLHEMGEPLLYPRLAEAIDLFPGTSLSTNCVALDAERGRDLLATSLERIRLCLDTVNPRVYPRIRRGGDHGQVLANVRAFLRLSKRHPIRVEIQKMISRLTASETVEDFVKLLELERHPQATVVEKTCEGLDTSEATDLHEAYYGCFQGYPFRWFVVLADGRVIHCCYDAHGQQPIGDLSTQTVREILTSGMAERLMEAFKRQDWKTLPRCGECYRNATGSGLVKDHLLRLAHRVDRVIPIKRLARKIINR